MNGTLWKYMYIFDGIYDITMHIKVMYFIIRVIPTWIGNIKIIYSLLARASASNNCHTSMLDFDVCVCMYILYMPFAHIHIHIHTLHMRQYFSGDWLNCWQNPSEEEKNRTDENKACQDDVDVDDGATAAAAAAKKTEMLALLCESSIWIRFFFFHFFFFSIICANKYKYKYYAEWRARSE